MYGGDPKQVGRSAEQGGVQQQGHRCGGPPLTPVVGQPFVTLSLEVLAVELGTLLGPEVPGTGGAALRGAGTEGRGRWALPPPPSPHLLAAWRSSRAPPCWGFGLLEGRLSFAVWGEEGASRSPGCAPVGGRPGDWEVSRVGGPRALPQCGKNGGSGQGPRSWSLRLS